MLDVVAATPDISVVLPVYQGMPYLRDAVESVLAQTSGSFEFVIGDDGSIDASRTYLESLRDPRVRFFPTRARSGLFPHLNRLVSRCRAPLIQFFCQDDVMEADCLARQVAFFKDHPTISLAIAKYSTISMEGATRAKSSLDDLPPVLSSSLAMQHFFYHGCIAGNLSTVCIRASAISRGAFDPMYRVAADYELWSRIASHHPIGINQRHLVRIRSHAKQLSRSRQSVVPFVMENAAIRKKILPHLPGSAREAALRFERKRHHVLDFHQALRCLISGRTTDAMTILRALGTKGTLQACAAWGYTLNNRLQPQAPWVLSESEST